MERQLVDNPWAGMATPDTDQQRELVDDPFQRRDIPAFTPPETKLPDPIEVARAEAKHWEQVSPEIEGAITRQREAAERLGLDIPEDFEDVKKDQWYQKGPQAVGTGLYLGVTHHTPGTLAYAMGDWVDRFSEDYTSIDNYFKLKQYTDEGAELQDITPDTLKEEIDGLKKERSDLITEQMRIPTPGMYGGVIKPHTERISEISDRLNFLERTLTRVDAGESLENIWTEGAELYSQGLEREGIGVGMKRWGAERVEKAAEILPMTGKLKDDFWGEIGGTIATVTPLIIATATAPFAPTLSKAISAGYIAGLGGQVAGSTSMEYDAYFRDKGYVPSFEEKMAIAAVDAFANMVVDRFRVARYISPMWKSGMRHAFMQPLKKNPKLMGSIYSKYIKGMPSLERGTKSWLETAPARILGEGAQEAAAEVGVALSKRIYMDPEDKPDLTEIGNRAWAGFRGGAYMGVMLGGVRGWAQNKQLDKTRRQHGVVQFGTDKQGDVVEILGKTDENTLSVLTEHNQLSTRPAAEVTEILDMNYDTFQEINKKKPQADKEVAIFQKRFIEEHAATRAEAYTSKRVNQTTGNVHEVVDQEGQAVAFVLKGNPDQAAELGNVLFTVDAQNPELPPQPYNPKDHPGHQILTENPDQFRDIVRAFVEDAELTKILDQHQEQEAQKEVEQTLKPFETGEKVRYDNKEGVVINIDNQQGEVDETNPEIRIRVDKPDGTEELIIIPREDYDKVKVGAEALPDTPETDATTPETRPEGEIAPEVQQTRELSGEKHKDNFAVTETDTEKRYEGQKTYKSKKTAQEIINDLNDTYEDIGFEAINVRDKSDPESPNQWKAIGVHKKPVVEAEPERRKRTGPRKYTPPFAKDPEVQKALSNDPSSFQEEVLQYLLAGGRFSAEDFKRHTGYSHNDIKGYYLWALAKKDRGGAEMDTWIMDSMFYQEDAGAMDQINELVEILANNNTLKKARDQLIEVSPEDIEARTQQEAEADIPPDIDQFGAEDSLEGIEKVGIEEIVPDSIHNIIAGYINDDGSINFEKLNKDVAENPEIFSNLPFGLTEAEFTELQNILNDESRQREIQEGLRRDYDVARDVPEEVPPPGVEGDALRDRRDTGERAPEVELTPVQQQEVDQRTKDLDDRIKALRDEISRVKAEMNAKKRELGDRISPQAELFDPAKPAESELFDVDIDASRENIERALAPYQAEIESKSKEIQDLIERREGMVRDIINVARAQGELVEAKRDVEAGKIADAEAQVNQDPSEAQKESGTYKKGHVAVQGMDITIENAKGSTRKGTGPDGTPWEVTLQNTYGYFKRSKGKDGDQVDVFLGDKTDASMVYVVDQVDTQTREFDEHKVMLGFESQAEAIDAYNSNYEAGWTGLGDITAMPLAQFKDWVGDGTRKNNPVSESFKDGEAPTKVSEPAYEGADRSDVTFEIPAKYKGAKSKMTVVEGDNGLMVRYGAKKLSDKLISEDVNDKIHIHQSQRGEAGDIKLSAQEARQVIDAFDNTTNQAVQRDVDALKEQVERAEVRELPDDDVRRRIVDERKAQPEALEEHHSHVVEQLKPLTDMHRDINIVRTEADLPARLRDKSKSKRIDNYTTGLYDHSTGQIYIISGNNVNANEAVRSALHEIVGHRGLRKLVGPRYGEIMNRIYQGMSTGDRIRIAQTYDTDSQNLIAEEYVAEIAETAKDPGMLRRFVLWFGKVFSDLFGVSLSRNDILYMIYQSKKADRAEHTESKAATDAIEGRVSALKNMNEIADLQGQEREVLHRTRPTVPDYEYRKVLSPGRRVQSIAQDTMLSPKLIIRETVKRGGRVTDATNFYLHENHLRSKNMVNVIDFDRNMMVPVLQELVALQTSHGVTAKQVNRYLKARASIEREDIFDQQALSKKDNPEGWTRTSAEEIVRSFEEAAGPEAVESLWEKINAVNDFVINRWQADGRITKEQADVYRQRQFYVPLRGWEGDNATDIFEYMHDQMDGMQGLERVKMRTSEPADPLPYMQAIAHASITMGNKNRYLQTVGNFIRDNIEIGKDMYGLTRVFEVKVRDETTGEDIWVKTAEKPSEQEFEQDRARARPDNPHHWRVTQQQAAENEVVFFEGGRQYVAWFADPQVARAINRKNYFDPGKAVTGFSKITRYLSQVFTSKNPLFFIPNHIRDAGQAAMFNWIQTELDPGLHFKNMPKAYGAVWRFRHDKLDPGNPIDKMFADFREQGGLTGFQRYHKDFNDVAMNLDKEMKKLGGQEHFTKEALRTVWDGGVQMLETGMALSEYTTRFATYAGAIEAGMSKLQATQMAKNVTVNFDRKGEMSQTVGSFIAFVNARMQSAYQKAYLAQHNPKKYLAGVGGFYLMGMMLNELFRNLSPKGEDGEPEYYDHIPDYFKYNFMVIPAGEKYITIPLPFEWRMFWGAGVASNLMANNKKSISEGTFEIFDNIIHGFSPIGGTLRPSSDPDAPKIAKIPGVRGVIPTALMPAYDLWINQTFTGAQIYREGFTKEVERYTPEYMKAMPWVNKHLLGFAKALNKAGGGTDLVPAGIDPVTGEYSVASSMFDWNPSQIEYVGEYYMGGVGTFINQTVKTVTAAAEKAMGRDIEMEHRNLPVYSRFVREPRRNMEYYRQYWTMGDEMRTRNFFRRQARKEGDPDGILKSYYEGPLMQAEQVYNKYKRRIDALGQRISIVDDVEQRRELVKERDDLVKKAVTEVENIEK